MISLTQSAARYISKLSNKLRRRMDTLSSREHFSGSQGRTLHFLLAQTGDVFQKDIEEEYSIRPSTASEMLKQMEQRGLIRRETVPYDNRLKKVVLTDQALAYRQQVRQELTQLEETLVQGISPDEMEVFFRVVEKMMDNLAE